MSCALPQLADGCYASASQSWATTATAGGRGCEWHYTLADGRELSEPAEHPSSSWGMIPLSGIRV